MNNQPAANDGGYIVTDPRMIRLFKQMETAPEWVKDKVLRYMIRFVNNDPKVHRLIDLRDKGFISHEEFMRRM